MRVDRRRGVVRLRLEPVEAAVLASMIDDLATTLEADALAPDDPVRRRLFPDGYRDDDAASAEFRALTETSLLTDRTGRARGCARQLAGGATVLELEADDGERWIQVLNDLRLALGTRLDITEDESELDPDDPDFEQRSLYHWLTAVQDSLVRALTR
jgi:hypothetical protein